MQNSECRAAGMQKLKNSMNLRVSSVKLTTLYLPQMILSGGETEGILEILKGKLVQQKNLIYICRNKVCQLSVDNLEKALHLMSPPIPRVDE